MTPRLGFLLIPIVLAVAGPAMARCPDLLPEMRTATIEGIQRQLLQLGYNPGRNDGWLGGATTAGIRAYQRNARLPVDGCPSEDLLNHMSFATRTPAVARKAAALSPVQEAQRLLTDKGGYLGPVDGKSGPKTRAALRAFQQTHGLIPSGEADGQTMELLRRMGQ
ncbi:MAG: peptidoglycan-binding domain-containing protein [Rhodospirillaceae bacterium]